VDFGRGCGHARDHVALIGASLLLAGTVSVVPPLAPWSTSLHAAAPSPPRETVSAAPPSEAPPGGYWSLGEQRERAREPLDGEFELTVGSVLFSLGLLRAGAGALSVWMAGRPDLCPSSDTDGDCSGLRIYGWVGVGEGALMFGTGIVYLAIGATRRARHQRWERGEPISWRRGGLVRRVQWSPWLAPGFGRAPGGGGLRVQLRF
jgi:hypothetical protein